MKSEEEILEKATKKIKEKKETWKKSREAKSKKEKEYYLDRYGKMFMELTTMAWVLGVKDWCGCPGLGINHFKINKNLDRQQEEIDQLKQESEKILRRLG